MPKAYSYLRFSTPQQLHGNSYRRQLDQSRAYAQEHGLDLDESLTFHDLGVSAYHGANITTGALGQFINAVDRGVVPPGSYLLVESLDRLSRDRVMEALNQFTSILSKNITIVTLFDRKTYTTELLNTNPFDLMGSLLIMMRAHEESATKSKRLRATWQAKRDKALNSNTPLTSICPAWLALKDGQFIINEARASIIKQIYQLAISGHGKGQITRKLNQGKIPTFGRSSSWGEAYVHKLLTTPAVIGTFVPHKTIIVDGKKQRVPEGEPIKDYFPAIISELDYYKVQELRQQRRVSPLGNRGKSISNLFTGLVICGSCGSPMHLVNKGAGKYLVCSSAKYGAGCVYHSFRYTFVEEYILLSLYEVDFRELFPRQYQQASSTIRSLQDRLTLAKSTLDNINQEIKRIINVFSERTPNSLLLDRLDQLEQEKLHQESLIVDLSAQLTTTQKLHVHPTKKTQDVTQALRRWLHHRHDYESRLKMSVLLKSFIDSIAFKSGSDAQYRGTITIVFTNTDPTYKRIIKVKANQQSAMTYTVSNGVRSNRKLLRRLGSGKLKRIDKDKTGRIEKFPRFS